MGGGGPCPVIRGGQSRQAEGTVLRLKAEMNLEISRNKRKACSWGAGAAGKRREVMGEVKGEVDGAEAMKPSRGHVMQAWPLSTQRRRLEFIFKLMGSSSLRTKLNLSWKNTALCRGKNGSRVTSEGFAGLQVWLGPHQWWQREGWGVRYDLEILLVDWSGGKEERRWRKDMFLLGL